VGETRGGALAGSVSLCAVPVFLPGWAAPVRTLSKSRNAPVKCDSEWERELLLIGESDSRPRCGRVQESEAMGREMAMSWRSSKPGLTFDGRELEP
jgi:hypothetical protein